MSFAVAAAAYDRFMGRFSEPLAQRFVDVVELPSDEPVLDVGCGPGALTRVLAARPGAARVVAVEPSAPFAAAVRQRLPQVEVQRGRADALPFDAAVFGAAVAQLVVHFMPDPVAGLREMARVTRPGGAVAATVWDHAGGGGPLALFWREALALDPAAHDEGDLPGAREGDLARIALAAGLTDVAERVLRVAVSCTSFEQWWEPFTLGVGPAGTYVRGLDEHQRVALRERCRQALPAAPFEVPAAAWCVTARVPGP